MRLSKNLPQYKVVYEIIRKHITDGVYLKGDILPSENELCTVHQTTRPTIRKALDRLVHEGYIKKKQGKGSIVMVCSAGCWNPVVIGNNECCGTGKPDNKNNCKTGDQAMGYHKPWPTPC